MSKRVGRKYFSEDWEQYQEYDGKDKIKARQKLREMQRAEKQNQLEWKDFDDEKSNK